ncbi:MAG: Na+/H+ antiporter subunit C [Bacteroidetes bacterium]|nr:Na+/H+ antiporter subunit C [Bacteroidota bacterium]MCH8523197.1 Na+/H+ antiporter subunit C [Balneolales bacterium]
MEILLAITVGVLFASSIYLLLKRSLVRVVIGVLILSNAVNLAFFTMGRLTRGEPPLIAADEYVAAAGVANALPQALILTAIVIGFGLFAFALALIYRYYLATGNLQSDKMADAETPVADKFALANKEGE